ncbi:MAG: putative nucleotidyltransferase [Cocleimonas sp.]|jgi:predicted nucleotidyltransferase
MLSDPPITSPTMSVEEIRLVENQLKLILVSKYFKSAKKMQSFLKYIVDKTIAGEALAIKQYTIGVDALLFTDDFDSEENPTVRIMGGRVRQRLNEYYETDRDEDEIIINMPKGSYIPEFKKTIMLII